MIVQRARKKNKRPGDRFVASSRRNLGVALYVANRAITTFMNWANRQFTAHCSPCSVHFARGHFPFSPRPFRRRTRCTPLWSHDIGDGAPREETPLLSDPTNRYKMSGSPIMSADCYGRWEIEAVASIGT